MMRRNRHALPNSWLLAAVLFHLGQVGLGAAESSGDDDQENRMAAIVAAVRAAGGEISRHRVRREDHDREQPIAKPRIEPSDVTSLETRHVVLQGDRIFLRKDAHERVLATKAHREELSAYDGEQTRTVVAGNCVNIHLGRFEHPDIYPAHSLAAGPLPRQLSALDLPERDRGDPRSSQVPPRSSEKAARSTSSRKSRPISRARRWLTVSVA